MSITDEQVERFIAGCQKRQPDCLDCLDFAACRSCSRILLEVAAEVLGSEDTLTDAIDEHLKRGGRLVFWVCPNGCNDIIDWDHDGHLATCRKCGTTNRG